MNHRVEYKNLHNDRWTQSSDFPGIFPNYEAALAAIEARKVAGTCSQSLEYRVVLEDPPSPLSGHRYDTIKYDDVICVGTKAVPRVGRRFR